MNRKGFFVSLVALLILMVLIGLVVFDQNVSRHRADQNWDESRKELVSELVYDIENSMIPSVVQGSIKNTLVMQSPTPTPLGNIINDIATNINAISDSISSYFTIPVSITTSIESLELSQTSPFEISYNVIIEYTVNSQGDLWQNNIPVDGTISVIGITHPFPEYHSAGPIAIEFWKVKGDHCIIEIIQGMTCAESHGICPLLLPECDLDIIEEAP